MEEKTFRTILMLPMRWQKNLTLTQREWVQWEQVTAAIQFSILQGFTWEDLKRVLRTAACSISKASTDPPKNSGFRTKIMEVHTGKICQAINSPHTLWLISGQHLYL